MRIKRRRYYIDDEQPLVKYGNLYNWPCTQGTGDYSLIPLAMENQGWMIPRFTQESTPFINYVGANGAYKIQDANLAYWGGTNNNNPTNILGMTIRGSGKRGTSGAFEYLNTAHWFWIMLSGRQFTVTQSRVSQSITRSELYSTEGCSIRLVRALQIGEQTIPDGQPVGTYTGNDGLVYPTTRIGDQVWLACNLAETKLRNGDLIPVITDNAQWASQTGKAMCYYGNDFNNVFI